MNLVLSYETEFERMLEGGHYILSKDEIAPGSAAIANKDWQKFRLSLKGLTTQRKLDKLRRYWAQGVQSEERELRIIRIQNYINALKRGGQLSKSGEIQK